MQCTTLRAKSVPIVAYGQFHSPHLMLQCNYFDHIPHLFLHRAAAGNVKISSFFRLSLLCPATWQRGANWRRLHQLTSWYDSDHLGSNMPRWDGRGSISQDFPSTFFSLIFSKAYCYAIRAQTRHFSTLLTYLPNKLRFSITWHLIFSFIIHKHSRLITYLSYLQHLAKSDLGRLHYK